MSHTLLRHPSGSAHLSARIATIRLAHDRLREIGWTGPTPGGGESPQDPDGSPNFFIDAPRPVDYPSLARLAIQTLREAYHIGHPRRLQCKAFSFDGDKIRFPTLRLRRRPA